MLAAWIDRGEAGINSNSPSLSLAPQPSKRALVTVLGLVLVGSVGVWLVATQRTVAEDPFIAEINRGDFATALRRIRPLAEQGNASAQNKLAFLYSYGYGVPQNDAEAMKWYRKAADQGNADAQSNLGVMYANGQGVPRNDAEAVKWDRKAAKQGFARAQRALGNMYWDGKGVPKDYAQAAAWFRKAAEQGLPEAQYDLSLIYSGAGDLPRDDAQQIMWLRKAAEQGFAPAQLSLGLNYMGGGHGVADDYVRAYMWFDITALLSDATSAKEAVESRTLVSMRMNPNEIVRAQEMAKTCRQSNYKQCGEPIGTMNRITHPADFFAANGRTSTLGAESILVPMQKINGAYVVPVLINSAITLDFVVDSGASDVTIPADVVLTLMRTGTLKNTDFIGTETYMLADGSTMPSARFRIRSLQIGDKIIET